MYICIYVYMYTCIYVYMYVCMYVYMYIRIYVYVYICICICMYALCICMYVCMYVYIYKYIYICMNRYIETVSTYRNSSKILAWLDLSQRTQLCPNKRAKQVKTKLNTIMAGSESEDAALPK